MKVLIDRATSKENISVEFVKRIFRLCRAYMICYSLGLDIDETERDLKSFRSHRTYSKKHDDFFEKTAADVHPLLKELYFPTLPGVVASPIIESERMVDAILQDFEEVDAEEDNDDDDDNIVVENEEDSQRYLQDYVEFMIQDNLIGGEEEVMEEAV